MASSSKQKPTDGFAGFIDRLNPLRRLGWAFLLAWVFVVFYSGVIDGYAGSTLQAESTSALSLLYTALPVTMSVISLMVIVGVERKHGSPTQHPALFWLSPFLTALSTPLLFLPQINPLADTAIFVVASILTGAGSGALWVMWGEYYSRLNQEEIETIAPASAILAALIALVISSMSGWVAVASATLLPLLAGASLYLSWQGIKDVAPSAEYSSHAERSAFEGAHETARSGLPNVMASMGLTGFGIMVACIFVCIEGSFWQPDASSGFAAQAPFLLSMVFMLALGWASTTKPRRISLSYLYRWMCPVLVIGFACIIVFENTTGVYIGNAVSLAARFAFCLMTQMFFARYVIYGSATAVQSYGLGWIFVHLGDLLGAVAVVFLNAGIADGLFTLTQSSGVCIALLVTAMMFVLGNDKSFTTALLQSAALPRTHDTAQHPLSEAPAEATEQQDQRSTSLDDAIVSLAEEYGLTPREVDVFNLLARGRSIPYIRDALVISRETVATHAKHIYAKLGVHSRQELIDLTQGDERQT